MHTKLTLWILLANLTLFAGGAHAYVGPGLGAGTLGVVVGLIASVFVALFAVIWYPIKRLLKKKGKNAADTSQEKQ
jgi:O-antigen/teichoic acid export membrane protein